jgi:hypothetical protein
MIIAFALVMTIFPLVFGVFYQVINNVRIQLTEHSLWEQFDRFHLQLVNDESNGIQMIAGKNQMIMVMKDGQEVRYVLKKGQLIRSLKQKNQSFRGHTVLLQHVQKVAFERLPRGWEMNISLSQSGAVFHGQAYLWGRIDE